MGAFLDISASAFVPGRDQKIGNVYVDLEQSRDEEGGALHTSVFVADRFKFGLQGLVGRSPERDQSRRVAGLHVAAPIGAEWTLLHETDWQWRREALASAVGDFLLKTTRSRFTWTRLDYEVTKGLTAFEWVESSRLDMSSPSKRTDAGGIGATFRPRPHFTLDSALGLALTHDKKTYDILGRAIGAYWF